MSYLNLSFKREIANKVDNWLTHLRHERREIDNPVADRILKRATAILKLETLLGW